MKPCAYKVEGETESTKEKRRGILYNKENLKMDKKSCYMDSAVCIEGERKTKREQDNEQKEKGKNMSG